MKRGHGRDTKRVGSHRKPRGSPPPAPSGPASGPAPTLGLGAQEPALLTPLCSALLHSRGNGVNLIKSLIWVWGRRRPLPGHDIEAET